MRRLTLTLPQVTTIREVALTVGGLGLLSAAAWVLALPAGLAASGVSLLLLEWLTRPTPGGRR